MINVIGLGYIGLPTALMMASHGVEVIGTDYNEQLVNTLNAGHTTFKEDGIDELFHNALKAGIKFTTEYQKTDIYVVSVPTPYDKFSKKVDACYVVAAVKEVMKVCPKGATVVIESTVSPGTIDKFVRPVIEENGFKIGEDINLVHAPERIIPGNMIYELLHNNRTIGADSREIGEKVKEYYASFCQGDIVVTDIRTAEMTKVVENTFRAVNIAFANELARICRHDNMNVYEIIRICNMHPRVNILQPGPGVGGHCISVDPWFLVGDYPQLAKVIDESMKTNDSQPTFVLERIYEIMKEKDELYAKEDFTDADGERASELEGEFAELDGWSAESNAETILTGLGISLDLEHKLMSELDGSQKVKVLLAQALFGNPDILLLDEPTNYLDIQSVRWLENFLLDFPNTVIVVSHDRHFLNKVCTHICDIDFGKIQMYVGNYDFWYEYTQMVARQQKDIDKKNEQKIKELQAFIQRFSANASKHKQATSRKKLLDNLQMENFTPSSRRYPYIAWKPDRDIGNDLLTVTNLSKTVNGRKVLNNISFVLTPGDKVAFVGTDELARTTLFQILMGEMEPDEGSFKWGVTTSQSYFPKDNGKYFDNCEYNLIDWLRQFSQSQYESDIRGWLGRMLFSGEEALKPARVLSGGEKVRCMLARTMLSGANVLILDEPTNHLDLESITALNKGMIEFTGSMLFATQDHECIQTVANRIMEILPGGLVDRRESYDDYIESEIAAQQRAALMQA